MNQLFFYAALFFLIVFLGNSCIESYAQNGGWSKWQNTSECSVTVCNKPGIVKQKRFCNNPKGGRPPCSGISERNVVCLTPCAN